MSVLPAPILTGVQAVVLQADAQQIRRAMDSDPVVHAVQVQLAADTAIVQADQEQLRKDYAQLRTHLEQQHAAGGGGGTEARRGAHKHATLPAIGGDGGRHRSSAKRCLTPFATGFRYFSAGACNR